MKPASLRDFTSLLRHPTAMVLAAALSQFARADTTFVDTFNTLRDYSGGDVTGTLWDGIVNPGNASVLNANSANVGQLTMAVTADHLGFGDVTKNTAPFLYKTVTGDFDVQVQVTGATFGNYSVAGLMVRAANPLGDSIAGEDYVAITLDFFMTQGIQTRSVDDLTQRDLSLIPNSTLPLFLRLTRTDDVFNAYYGTNGTNWTQIGFWTGEGIQGGPGTNDHERPDLAGEVQVGLWHGSFSTLDSSARFDDFRLTTFEDEPSTFPLKITRAIGPATGYNLEWSSRAGKMYNIRGSGDLVGGIPTWNLVQGNIPATPPNNVFNVSHSGSRRFFAVEEFTATPEPTPPLVNGGFELPQIPNDGGVGAVAAPWMAVGTPSNGEVVVRNPSTADYPAVVPDPTNVAHVFFHTAAPEAAFGIAQTLGLSFTADTNYEVNVQVGHPLSFDWPGYRIELRAGATVIAADDGTLTPAAGTFATSTLNYTYDAADAALIGQTLEIHLLSRGENPGNGTGANGWAVNFDDVSFSATSTVIDAGTLDAWSAPYRGWHHHPNHVISSNPQIPGYETFRNTDVPTVYQLPGVTDQWFMSFIGFNGLGYNSFVAESTDLVTWTNPVLAMGFGPVGEFDHGGAVVGAYLYESYDIKAPRLLKQRDNVFWSLYGCYPLQGGYELLPGYEGVASSDDGISWSRAKNSPILAVQDADHGTWEQSSIYQPWLVEHDGAFFNFYNAANSGIEQTGLAFSDDLLEWGRYAGNPVVRVRPGGFDNSFCADPKVFRDGDHWTMFYFGVGNGGAHIMIAFSRDLRNWTAHPEPLYRAGGNPSGLDSQYAHKISLVYHPGNDTFYMHYCAVGNQGRGIGLITSKPLPNP